MLFHIHVTFATNGSKGGSGMRPPAQGPRPGTSNSFTSVQANYLMEIDQEAAGLRYVKGN